MEPEATAASPRKKRRRSRKQESRQEAAGDGHADAARGEGQRGPAVPGASPLPAVNGRSPGDRTGVHRGGAPGGAGGERVPEPPNHQLPSAPRGSRRTSSKAFHERVLGGCWRQNETERVTVSLVGSSSACARLSGRPGAHPSRVLEQGAGVRRGPGAAQTRVRSSVREGRCGRARPCVVVRARAPPGSLSGKDGDRI